jgi:type II secretory pathway predicted ATPase ExeA/outer membrane protein OmpA-like peptidoglycan-associated protein
VYGDFYGFAYPPFGLSPDVRFIYRHPSFSRARAYLEYALYRGEGFVMITGSPGTGKTTLVQDMLDEMEKTGRLAASVESTQVGADDLLRLLVYAFGIQAFGLDKATLLYELRQLLLEQTTERERAIVIIDEAQNLSIGSLEELRLLTNLQRDGQPMLQIFLVGQEALRDTVRRPELEQLHQRIIAACHLDLLDLKETRSYMEHRLLRAGWSGDPVFKSGAIRRIFGASGGVPRLVNKLCDRLLLYGGLEERHVLSEKDAQMVLEDLRGELLDKVEDPCPPASDDIDDLAYHLAPHPAAESQDAGADLAGGEGAVEPPRGEGAVSPGPHIGRDPVSRSEGARFSAPRPVRGGGTGSDADEADVAEGAEAGHRRAFKRSTTQTSAARIGAHRASEEGVPSQLEEELMPAWGPQPEQLVAAPSSPPKNRPGSATPSAERHHSLRVWPYVFVGVLLLLVAGGGYVFFTRSGVEGVRLSEIGPASGMDGADTSIASRPAGLPSWFASSGTQDQPRGPSSPRPSSRESQGPSAGEALTPGTRSGGPGSAFETQRSFTSSSPPQRGVEQGVTRPRRTDSPPAQDAVSTPSAMDSAPSPAASEGLAVGPPSGMSSEPGEEDTRPRTGDLTPGTAALSRIERGTPAAAVDPANGSTEALAQTSPGEHSSASSEAGLNARTDASETLSGGAVSNEPETVNGSDGQGSAPGSETAAEWRVTMKRELRKLGLVPRDDGELRLTIDLADELRFAFNSSEIPVVSRGILDALARLFNRYPGVGLTIVGHTDPAGPSEYNRILSLKRAKAVEAYLRNRGIEPERLSSEGRGEDGLDIAARFQDGDGAPPQLRRIEILVEPPRPL